MLVAVAACGGAFSATEDSLDGGSGTAGNLSGTGSAGDVQGAGGSIGSSAGGAIGVGGDVVGVGGSTGGVSIIDSGPTPTSDARPPFVDSATLDSPAPPRDSSTVGNGFCAQSVHTFCSDFDQPNALSQWTQQIVHSGGIVALASTASVSAPSSLQVKSPPSTDMSSSEAVIQKRFDLGIKTHALLMVDVQTTAFATLGSSNAITLTNGSMTLMLVLQEQGGQVTCNLNMFGGGYASPLTPCPVAMALGKWNHVDIDVTVNGLAIQVKVTLNGTPFNVLYQVPTWSGVTTLGIGSYPGNPTKFWEGYYDNVALDIQ
jgi:hypothetical protein